VVERLIRTIPLIVLVACVVGKLPSRSMEMPSTTMRGAQAVSGPSGLMAGIDCRMAMARK
jgi:hypothetical protein